MADPIPPSPHTKYVWGYKRILGTYYWMPLVVIHYEVGTSNLLQV